MTTGRTSKQKLKKKKTKKILNLNRVKKNTKTFAQLIKIKKELQTLCPEAEKISVFHLAVAVTKKYKYYMTGEEHILNKADIIFKTYRVRVCRSIYEINEFENPVKHPLEFYS